MNISKELLDKYNALLDYLKSLDKVAVAYSSGVDSTFLLYAAYAALKENTLALTAVSSIFPSREKNESNAFTTAYHIPHLEIEVNQLEVEEFKENPVNRCYICKKALFTKMLEVCQAHHIPYLIEGSNLDDEGDYRPGLTAIEELNVLSPLRKFKFTKQEIRELSRYLKLPTYDKPSFACLSSRFPYGDAITIKKLKQVEQAEDYLLGLGFKQLRVRIHQNIARIELLEEDFNRLMDASLRVSIDTYFKSLGFQYISVDLQPFHSGNLNKVLEDK